MTATALLVLMVVAGSGYHVWLLLTVSLSVVVMCDDCWWGRLALGRRYDELLLVMVMTW